MLHDPRVVTRGEPRSTGTACETEQLAEPEASVAARAGIRRFAARIRVDERLDDCAPERFAGVDRHVREAEAVARLAGRDHGFGRATRALRCRRFRVDPEP